MEIKTDVFEVSGRVIVKVTSTADGVSKQAVAEAGDGTSVDDAFQRALQCAAGLDPIQKSSAPQAETPKKSEVADFPDLDQLEPLADPKRPEPLARSNAVRIVPSKRSVQTKPDASQSGKVSPGLITALEDACESERVPLRQPASDEQAICWIRGIRELGWKELPDNLEVPDPPEKVEEAANA